MKRGVVLFGDGQQNVELSVVLKEELKQVCMFVWDEWVDDGVILWMLFIND